MRARRIFCLLLAAFLLAALLPQALAAGLIETDRPVTLTVRFFHDKAPVSGAPFSLYRVADVSAYGEFTLTGDFKDDPVRLDDRSSDGWRALAETLRAFVLRDSRKPLDSGVTGSTCLLTFPNRQKTLRPGLSAAGRVVRLRRLQLHRRALAHLPALRRRDLQHLEL